MRHCRLRGSRSRSARGSTRGRRSGRSRLKSAAWRPQSHRCPAAGRRGGRCPGCSRSAASIADSPSSASPTISYPSASSNACALERKLGWSSTIRTVVTRSWWHSPRKPAIRLATPFQSEKAGVNPGKEPLLTQMGHRFGRMLGRRGKGVAPALWVGCVAAQRLRGVAAGRLSSSLAGTTSRTSHRTPAARPGVASGAARSARAPRPRRAPRRPSARRRRVRCACTR